MSGSLFGRAAALALPWRLGALAAALALVAFASSLRAGGGGGGFAGGYFNNLLHLPLYGLLALALLLVAGRAAPRRPLIVLLVFVAVVVVAWLDEWHQATVPGRYSSAVDMGSDALGAVLALALARWAAQDEPELRAGVHLALLGGAAALLWGFFHPLLGDHPPPFLPS